MMSRLEKVVSVQLKRMRGDFIASCVVKDKKAKLIHVHHVERSLGEHGDVCFDYDDLDNLMVVLGEIMEDVRKEIADDSEE